MFKKIINKIFKNSISSFPPIESEDMWRNYLSQQGYTLSAEDSIKIATVLRCVDVVSKTMASLGCILYKKTNTGRQKAEKHSLYNILKMLPNKETTAYEFWHMYIFNLMLTSGAYAKIIRDRTGKIIELWNIPTKNVVMYRNNKTKERYIEVYYTDENRERKMYERLYEDSFLYTPSLRFQDGDISQDFVTIASEILGLTSNLNTYANKFFKNGSNLGGFVVYPGKINDTLYQKFKTDWSKKYSGVTQAHKWAILESGFDIKPFSSEPEKAQALESRKFQVIEICRMFGIPPHKVFSLETTNFASMEQSNIEYTQETINPMNVRLSQSIYRSLLNKSEKRNYYANFNMAHLLKGDMSARTAYYSMMRQNGIFSTNDILELEDMNSISDEEGGNTRLVNGALIPLTVASQKVTEGGEK